VSPTIHPSYTLDEVIEAGWGAYVGSGIESAGRRLALVRTWAEMIGRDRALAELEEFIRACGGKEAAAERANVKVSTLDRLRREFKKLERFEDLPSASPSLRAGEVLQGSDTTFTVEAQIGAGGVGRVFRGTRNSDRMPVALKLLATDRFVVDDRVRQRFLRESRLARGFDHPNLVRSFEPIVHRGLLVSVLELVSGETLADRLRRGVPDPQTARSWMAQIAKGLAELHGQDIVHRDLTPKNILFRDKDTLALCDFGVARARSDETLTTNAEQMGSLIYISPQQRTDPHEAWTEDDVYSLGQIYFYLVTGVNPHNAGRLDEHSHAHDDATAALIERMRSYQRRRRPRDGAEVLELVERLAPP